MDRKFLEELAKIGGGKYKLIKPEKQSSAIIFRTHKQFITDVYYFNCFVKDKYKIKVEDNVRKIIKTLTKVLRDNNYYNSSNIYSLFKVATIWSEDLKYQALKEQNLRNKIIAMDNLIETSAGKTFNSTDIKYKKFEPLSKKQVDAFLKQKSKFPSIELIKSSAEDLSEDSDLESKISSVEWLLDLLENNQEMEEDKKEIIVAYLSKIEGQLNRNNAEIIIKYSIKNKSVKSTKDESIYRIANLISNGADPTSDKIMKGVGQVLRAMYRLKAFEYNTKNTQSAYNRFKKRRTSNRTRPAIN